jgi:apolipoprotein N-acyltransferase
VASKIPAVKAAWRTKIASAWAFVVALFSAFLSWIGERFTDVWEQLQPVRELMGTVPLPLWIMMAAAFVGFLFWQSRQAVNDATADYNEGRLL